MAAKRGFSCVLARNTGTYGTPVWNSVANVRDVNLALQKGESEAGGRDSDWEQFLPARKRAELTYQVPDDYASDDYAALELSYDTDTVIDMVIADGVIATVGTHYFRCDMYCFGFDHAQPLDGAAMIDITQKIAASSNAPTFTTVS